MRCNIVTQIWLYLMWIGLLWNLVIHRESLELRYFSHIITIIGNCSSCSWIIFHTLSRCVISPDSIGLQLMTSTCYFSFISCRGIWWWQKKSWSINAIPVAPQSISSCLGNSWISTVNVQVTTKWFHSIDHSKTSNLQTDKREIPTYFESFKTKDFLSTNEPSVFG